jgi:hypothetical protein
MVSCLVGGCKERYGGLYAQMLAVTYSHRSLSWQFGTCRQKSGFVRFLLHSLGCGLDLVAIIANVSVVVGCMHSTGGSISRYVL